jgi:hypothetical protein
MSALEIDCEGLGRLRFPGGRANVNPDLLVCASAPGGAPEVLGFFDSRGVGGNFTGSIAERFLQFMNSPETGSSRPYLLVCRPLELTTWATLLNFLANNALKPRHIVTNMGFVDFTPKKRSILVDAITQVETLLGAGVARSQFVEKYTSSEGGDLDLYSMTYGEEYRHAIESLAALRSLCVINTPPVSADIRVGRRRPRSFFRALDQANAFNRSIDGAVVVDLPPFDERHTYDAVHYTDAGNELVFETIQEHLYS